LHEHFSTRKVKSDSAFGDFVPIRLYSAVLQNSLKALNSVYMIVDCVPITKRCSAVGKLLINHRGMGVVVWPSTQAYGLNSLDSEISVKERHVIRFQPMALVSLQIIHYIGAYMICSSATDLVTMNCLSVGADHDVDVIQHISWKYLFSCVNYERYFAEQKLDLFTWLRWIVYNGRREAHMRSRVINRRVYDNEATTALRGEQWPLPPCKAAPSWSIHRPQNYRRSCRVVVLRCCHFTPRLKTSGTPKSLSVASSNISRFYQYACRKVAIK